MTLGDIVVVMAGGVIQQVGPPLEVYRNPANRFVASFVGMPPMNMLAGRLERDGDRVVFVEGPRGDHPSPNIVPLPDPLPPGLAPWAGREVTLGVRPQAFHASCNGDGGIAPFAVSVGVMEPLGEQMDVSCATSLHPQVIARLPSDVPLRPGERAVLGLDTRRIHIFEPGDFGRNLTLSSGDPR